MILHLLLKVMLKLLNNLIARNLFYGLYPLQQTMEIIEM